MTQNHGPSELADLITAETARKFPTLADGGPNAVATHHALSLAGAVGSLLSDIANGTDPDYSIASAIIAALGLARALDTAIYDEWSYDYLDPEWLPIAIGAACDVVVKRNLGEPVEDAALDHATYDLTTAIGILALLARSAGPVIEVITALLTEQPSREARVLAFDGHR